MYKTDPACFDSYPDDLHIVDQSYSVDVVIRQVGSSDQLAEAVYRAMNTAAGQKPGA